MSEAKTNGGPRYFFGISVGTWATLGVAAIAAIATYTELRSDMRQLQLNDIKQDVVIKEFREKLDTMQQTVIETKTLVQILITKSNKQ